MSEGVHEYFLMRGHVGVETKFTVELSSTVSARRFFSSVNFLHVLPQAMIGLELLPTLLAPDE